MKLFISVSVFLASTFSALAFENIESYSDKDSAFLNAQNQCNGGYSNPADTRCCQNGVSYAYTHNEDSQKKQKIQDKCYNHCASNYQACSQGVTFFEKALE